MAGKYADPLKTEITLSAGWSYIGYIPAITLPVNSALAGINARVSDQIKGQTGFATYTGTSWVGNLSYMEPGKGYMYYSNSAVPLTFVYPSSASQPMMSPMLISMMSEEMSEGMDSEILMSPMIELQSLMFPFTTSEARHYGLDSHPLANVSEARHYGLDPHPFANVSEARHCEGGSPKQSRINNKSGLLRSARNDVSKCTKKNLKK